MCLSQAVNYWCSSHSGSYRSRAGKGFICLTSTYKHAQGSIASRIRPTLSPGTVATLHRGINYYVVIEYGMVMLKGKSTWERAEALISIAHPDFRDELVKEAERMKTRVEATKQPRGKTDEGLTSWVQPAQPGGMRLEMPACSHIWTRVVWLWLHPGLSLTAGTAAAPTAPPFFQLFGGLLWNPSLVLGSNMSPTPVP